jgi:hypothetical protein
MTDVQPAPRHHATLDALRWFDYDHLPPFLQAVSEPCHRLAFDMAATLPDGPELTIALRKLLEAKDAFVRQALLAHQRAARTLQEIGACTQHRQQPHPVTEAAP